MFPFLAIWMLAMTPAQAAPAATAVTCDAGADRVAAVTTFFDLAAGQAIGEYHPTFVLTDCLVALAGPNGRVVALLDDGNRVAQVVERVVVEKRFKRDPDRYRTLRAITFSAGKAPPVGATGLDRLVIVGRAAEIGRDRSRAVATLRALAALMKPQGLLGVVEPGEGAGVDAFVAAVGEAGWVLADQTVTTVGGLVLLKFQRA